MIALTEITDTAKRIMYINVDHIVHVRKTHGRSLGSSIVHLSNGDELLLEETADEVANRIGFCG
jgi:uncharacterized protein YlzI (FlbEa/FlbD family)